MPPAVNLRRQRSSSLQTLPKAHIGRCGVLAHPNDIDGNAIKLLYKPLELECQPGSIFPRSDQQCTLRSGHYVAADNLRTHHIWYQKFWSKNNTLTSPLEFCFLSSTASESPRARFYWSGGPSGGRVSSSFSPKKWRLFDLSLLRGFWASAMIISAKFIKISDDNNTNTQQRPAVQVRSEGVKLHFL